MMKRSVLFGGGDILDDAGLWERLRPDDIIVCADSGYLHCKRLGLTPRLLVGDFDSIGEIPAGIEILRYEVEKNFTDTALACDWIVNQGCRELLFAGMTGGSRFDHSLANLQTMASCVRRGLSCRMTDGVSDLSMLCAQGGAVRWMMPPREHCYFSLIAFSEQCDDVTITGGKYPLDHYLLRFDEARAVSNEFTGVPVRIEFGSGTLLVIVTPMDHRR